MHKLFHHQLAMPALAVVLVAGLIGLTQLLGNLMTSLTIHQNLQTQAESLERAPSILAQQSQQLQFIASRQNELNSQKVHLGDHLTFSKYLESLCQKHKVRLVSLPEEKILEGATKGLAQEQFEVEGSLRKILLFIHQIEYQDRIGRIKAASFERQYIGMGRNRKSFLIARIELLRFEKT